MDLRIRITDENGDVLEDFSVYQDGSDSEGAAHIHGLVAMKFKVEDKEEDREQFDDWVCFACGSDDVDATAWANVNTGQVSSYEGPLNTYYCNGCGEAETVIIPRREYQDQEK